MVETRTLTIPLTEVPVGVADMRFAAWDPLSLEFREIIAKKKEYAEGEIVYVKYKVKNVGTAASIATIEIRDADTGAVLQTYTTPSIEGGGYMFKTADAGVRVGPMPARDWSLSFKVTP